MSPPPPNQPEPDKTPASCRVLEFLCGTLTTRMLEVLADAPDGARRYNELRRLFPATTPRTLTLVLRRLESVGVVERRVFAEVPARVEYSLSPLGHTFMEPVRHLREWASAHADELDAVLAESDKPGREKPRRSRASHRKPPL